MNAQYGRQPAAQQTAPPTDPRTRNHSPPKTSGDSPGGICRDFIWGICTMGAQCIYRHELEFEAMKSVLKFCHDHQNRTGCTRPDCTYLHTSREEQNIFLATGQIPRVLIDRYTGISNASAAPPPVSENATSVPPQPHHTMYEYITQPPPPPPPPPTPATAGARLLHSPMQGSQSRQIHGPIASSMPMAGPMPGPMQCPMPGPMQGPMPGPMQGPMPGPMQGPMPGPMQGPMPGPMQGPMPGPMQGPMPGPMQGHMQGPISGPMQGPIPGPMTGPTHGPMSMPAPMPPNPAPMAPPPPPPISAVSSTRTAASIFTAPLPLRQNLTSIYHPTVSQSSLPPMFDPTRPPPPIPQATPCRHLKRAADDSEAGPSKVRKVDPTNDNSCECCVRRLIRLDQFNHQIERLEQEVEQARNELSGKIDSYENRKQLLRSVFTSPDLYRRAEDYVENGSPSPFSPRNEIFNTNLFNNPVTSNNNSKIQTLLELLLGNSTRGLMESMPSSSASDDPVGLLPLAARTRPNKSSPDILGTLLNLIKNASGPSQGELSLAGSSGNGFSRFLSAGGTSPPERARPLPPISLSKGVAGIVPYAPTPRDAGPPRYPPPPRHFPPPAPADPAPHPAPPAYPPSHTAPPPRPHYSHEHFAPNTMHMANPPYPGAGSALTQPLRPPMPPQQPQNSPYFMGGRYPNQHYYPYQ